MGDGLRYRREIDGLRTVAVIPVILFHAGLPGFSGGFVGVDVFFVISGYLITSILITDIDNGNFSIANFYERRVRRIAPALFLIIFSCIPFAWLWMIPDQLKELCNSLVAVTFFSSNILFWHESGYFDLSSELKPLLHTWSLAVEEQYYVLFPVAFMLLWRSGRKIALACLIVAALGSLALSEWGWRNAPVANFYFASSRAWELFAGAICAVLGYNQAQSSNNPLSSAGLALIVFSIFYFDKTTPFPSIYTLAPVLGTALVIYFGGPGTLVASLLGTSGFVGVGLISYSAYLWHQPLFAFARIRSVGEPSAALMLGLSALALALGWLSWRFVERPFRRTGTGPLPTRRSIFTASALIAGIIVALGIVGHLENGFPDRAIAKRFAVLEYQRDTPPYRPCADPELVQAGLNMCKYLPGAATDAALIGDSHAEDKLYGLYQADKSRRWILLANAACPPVLNIQIKGDQKNCDIKIKTEFDYVARNPAIKTVALSFYGNYVLTTAYAADHVQNNLGPDHIKITSRLYNGEKREDIFFNGLRDAIIYLQAHGKKVVILVDQPELPFFPVDCLKGKPDCEIPQRLVMARQAIYRKLIMHIKTNFANVEIFDPINIFCVNGKCSYTQNNVTLYRDSHHLTLMGSVIYAQQFMNWERASQIGHGVSSD